MISTGCARSFYCLARVNLLDAAASLTLHHQCAFEISVNFHSQNSRIPYSPIRKLAGSSFAPFPHIFHSICALNGPRQTETPQ